MPDFLPFRGTRYRSADLDPLTAPPYDVIDPDERGALAARSPQNAVRLILPEGDDCYARAAEQLARWRANGVLAVDATPCFYGYRMDFTDEHARARSTVGVLGALVLPAAAGEGDVLPHERTLPKAKSDRLALLRATRANLDPIWGLSPAVGLSSLVTEGAWLAVTVDEHGVRHTLHAVDDPDRIAAIRDAIASAALVLADGHHRFETAIAYRDERQAAGVSTEADAAVLCLVVELAEEQLWVQPIHRLLTGIRDAHALRSALAANFTIEDAGPNTAEGVGALERTLSAQGGVGLVDAHGLARLVPDPDARRATQAELPPELADVASAWFEALASPALVGVDVTYRNDAATVAALVDKGAVDAAILLPPVTVGQIRAAALAGIRMPQKTTFFAPKPRTGLVFRVLDD